MNSCLLFSFLLTLSLLQLSSAHPQQLSHCSNNHDCNENLVSPIVNHINNIRHQLTTHDQPDTFVNQLEVSSTRNTDCTSIRDCDPGLVCVSGNPIGKCFKPEDIRGISHLAVILIEEGFIEESPSISHSPPRDPPGSTEPSGTSTLTSLAQETTITIPSPSPSIEEPDTGLSKWVWLGPIIGLIGSALIGIGPSIAVLISKKRDETIRGTQNRGTESRGTQKSRESDSKSSLDRRNPGSTASSSSLP